MSLEVDRNRIEKEIIKRLFGTTANARRVPIEWAMRGFVRMMVYRDNETASFSADDYFDIAVLRSDYNIENVRMHRFILFNDEFLIGLRSDGLLIWASELPWAGVLGHA